MPAIQGEDGLVGLESHQGLASADGLGVAWAVKREDLAQAVDLSEPDRVCDVGLNGRNKGVGITVQHGFPGNTGLKSLCIGVLKAFQPFRKRRGAGLPIFQDLVVGGADREAENDLILVSVQTLAEALYAG